MLMDNCSNCFALARGACPTHGAGLAGPAGRSCDESYHYLGSSPRELPNAGKGEPAVLCGICYRLLRGHRGDKLQAREAGWNPNLEDF